MNRFSSLTSMLSDHFGGSPPPGFWSVRSGFGRCESSKTLNGKPEPRLMRVLRRKPSGSAAMPVTRIVWVWSFSVR